jgi:hypothetical protein
MFDFRKHDNEVCFAIHLGYDIKWRIILICFNFYKYEMTINAELGSKHV